MKETEQIIFLEKSLERQLRWIAAADSRVSIIFALNTAMIGFLAAISPNEVEAWTTGQAVSSALAIVFGLASLLFLCFATFPRTGGPKGSLIYFGGVCQKSSDQFRKEVADMSETGLVEDLSDQCHRNAEIAEIKFAWIRRSLTGLFMAIVPWAVAIFLLYNG